MFYYHLKQSVHGCPIVWLLHVEEAFLVDLPLGEVVAHRGIRVLSFIARQLLAFQTVMLQFFIHSVCVIDVSLIFW